MTDGVPMSSVPMSQVGWRPVPDPTELSTAAIAQAVASITQYVDGQLAVRDQRIDGIDEATKIRLATLVDVEHRFIDRLDAAVRLTDEKFAGVAKQLEQRDVLARTESALNSTALQAALAAQKESARATEESGSKAIAKSEMGMNESLRTLGTLNATQNSALAGGLAEVKERVTRIEGAKLGAHDDRTGLYAAAAFVFGFIGIVVVIIGFVATRPEVVIP